MACGTAEAHARTAFPLSGPVSNICDGPLVPRASKLSATRTPAAHGCRATKSVAPRSPTSSPSLNSATTSFPSRGPAWRARSVSSSAATPAPSSAAPGDAGTES